LFPDDTLARIERTGVIAVLVLDDPQRALPVGRALLDGGIDVIELTLRTPAALESLSLLRRELPELILGAGTVRTPRQVDEVIEAGAAFALAPGLNRAVVEHATARRLPFIPGIMTPSELNAALELGCREVKFFPAEPAGGVRLLASLHSPFSHLGVRYIPLGGLNPANAPAYLAEPSVLAIGGSWIATRELIRREAWDLITAAAREARQLVDRHCLGGPR
jgi:2-dehydro-3-deoxyphosphogluconate aldolase/(4S)-4-hydroxy-2-oxoglutarate aldolase